MKPKAYVGALQNLFADNANAEIASEQSKYMRDLFPFYGLKRPERNAIQRKFIDEQGIPESVQLAEVIRLCFAAEHRELHYFALDILKRRIRREDADFVNFLEELIQTKSWWDSVDYLASICGVYFLNHPSLVPQITDHWIESNNFWLNRVAIIFQLLYKDKTDEALLYRYIQRHAESNEFFIQKACGWALRQHSKRNPKSVKRFVDENRLSPLTVREGLKHLNKNK